MKSIWSVRSLPVFARSTGQPDFATIRINYVPDQLCIELKVAETLSLVLSRRRRVS